MTDNPIAKQKVVYEIPGMAHAIVRKDLIYRAPEGRAAPLTMDVYHPADAGVGRRPVVVIVAGYNDVGFEKVFGCRFKDIASTVS
jgi:hypothetical protein